MPVILMAVWASTGALGGGRGAGGREDPAQELSVAAQDETAVGYVDHANLILRIPGPLPAGAFLPYADEEAAMTALARGEIAAYYVVPEDYRQSGNILRVSQELPALPPDRQQFNWVLVANLLPEADLEQISRLNWPFNSSAPEFVALETSGEAAGGGNPTLPFIVTVAVMAPLFTSGSYLLQSLTQEKSSRIMEVLLVSLRPWQMLAGKLTGLAGLTLVQYLIWGFFAGLGGLVTGQGLAGLLDGIQLSPAEVLLVVPYALGGFLLYAGIMAGIGALSPDLEGSRSWVFLISLPMMLPIFLWLAIVNAPNGPIAVALSLIPFSAPIAMMMRLTSTAVPAWQLIGSLVLLLLAGAGMVWLMARLFRAQTLLSGEALSLRRFAGALLRGSEQT